MRTFCPGGGTRANVSAPSVVPTPFRSAALCAQSRGELPSFPRRVQQNLHPRFSFTHGARVSTEFYRVLLGFTECYQVLLGFSGFLPSLSTFYWVSLDFTGFSGFHRVLLNFQRVLPSFSGFYRLLFSFT